MKRQRSGLSIRKTLFLLCVTCLLIASGSRQAISRDLDGKHANSPLKGWFDSLKSDKGPCCSFADGVTIEDVDVETKDGRYRVRIEGEWLDVPNEALVTVPNKFGRPVVWPFKDSDGKTQIRCFIAGAGI